jgi:predicted transcriptional regulator of viral defense system
MVRVSAAALPSIISRSDLATLGISKHRFYAMVGAGELEQIAPGYYLPSGELDDTTATLASISLRKPAATICLLSALSLHELTDEIPRETDIALPRGEPTLTTRFTPVRWPSFDRATFELGRAEHRLRGTDLSIGLYAPERTIIDAFRLRHEVGTDTANEALKRWLRQSGNAPAALLALARSFPKALPALRATVEILL